MRKPLLALPFLMLALTVPAAGVTIVLVNNGLGPGDAPENTISDAAHAAAAVVVRDAGCGSSAAPSDPCPAPGPPTSLRTLANAEVSFLEVRDRSRIEVAGGTVTSSVLGRAGGHLHVNGGHLASALAAFDESSVRISAGTLASGVTFDDRASATIEGGTFSGTVGPIGSATLAVLGGDLSSDTRCTSGASFALTGGMTRDVLPSGTCLAALRGGHVRGKLDAGDDSRVEISDGDIDFEALAFGNARMVISGGTVGRDVRAHDTASISLRGGVQGMGVAAWDDSIVHVSGGLQNRTHGFDVRGSAEIVIYGRDFAFGLEQRGPGPVPETSGFISANLADGTQLVSVPFTREANATLAFAAPLPVFTSEVVQTCAAAKLKALASAAAGEAKCHAALSKGGASLAKKRAKLDPAAQDAAEDKLKIRAGACQAKSSSKLRASWLKAQDKAEASEPGTCHLDAGDYNDLVGQAFLEDVARLVRASGPREFVDSDAVCLASDANAIAAATRYLADALKAQGLGFKKGLDPAAVAAAGERLAKSADKLLGALAKLGARDAKAGRVCGRAHPELLIALADGIAHRTVEGALGVSVEVRREPGLP